MTKDELIIENAMLQNDNGTLVAKDRERRQEFAKAFGWYKVKSTYDYHSDPEPSTPSWEQIFIHVGKLLHKRDALNLEIKFEQLDLDVQFIKERLSSTAPTDK